jgi:hypothetical protein
MTHKAFFVAATAAATIFVSNQQAWSADDLANIKEQITKQHDQSVKRLQDWIHQVSIAAENRGYPERGGLHDQIAAGSGVRSGETGADRG